MDVETVATYDRTAVQFADRWWDTRLTAHMDRFVAALGGAGGGPVLDLGCGPGRDTAWFGELGLAAIGMDASSGMLDEARRRVGVGVDVVRGDLVALPFGDASAGGAWVCASLLHLTESDASVALGDVARVVRDGGPLFCGVQVGVGSGTKSSPEGDRRFTFWSPSAFSAMVASSGFDVVAYDVAESDDAPGVTWVSVHAVRTTAGAH